MTLDELVKDIDVEEVRNKNMTDEKISSIYTDLEKGKYYFNKLFKGFAIFGWLVIILMIIAVVLEFL